MSFGYKLADGVVLDGLLTNITTASGSIGLGHDLGGYVNRITYPAGLGSEGFLNNALGDILSWTNGRSSVFSFQYNQRRQLTNAIGPTNLTFSVLLDAVGNAQAFTDGRGFITTNLWSATRKLLATAFPATPQGVPVIGNAYDNRDWLARTTNALGKVTQFGLDAAGRWISITDPLNRANRFGFDADGRNTSVTNAALEVASQQLNARGEATNLIDAASHSVGLALDAVGNTTALTNRNSKRWQFGFDKANRQTNIISPLLHANSVTFDQSGLPNIVRQPSGKNATNSFDAKRRLTNITDQVGIRLLKWDANDNLTNIVEGANSNSWTWDAYDLMSSSKDPDGNLIQFRMDANGGVTNLIYPGNRVVTYKLNAFGLPTNIVDWLGGQSFIEYDLALRPVRITRPNGSIRIINRNGAGEITNIVEQLANNAPIAFFKQHWNDAGRIDWEFAAHARRGVSPAGLTNTTFCDADNRLTNFNGVIVTNDLDGNMTWGPLTNNTFATYTFNARNWLVGTAVPSGPQVTYGYDALGMRIKNGVTNYYIYGLGLLYEITETATSTSTSTYHSDYRGSTIAITDGNGNVTDRAEYSAYGLFTYRSGSTDTPFWFNGRYGVQTDPNGLLYMRRAITIRTSAASSMPILPDF